jgi:hypothetical protein
MPGLSKEEQKEEMCMLLRSFADCFAWEYTYMPGLSRDLSSIIFP